MHALFRSVSERGAGGGKPLPSVWSKFTEAGIKMFPGDMCLWAGPPGAGKSAAALNFAIKAQIPSLYISMDMGPRSVAARSAAILSGDTLDVVNAEMARPEGEKKYAELLRKADHLFAAYPSRPDAEHLALHVMAFQEIHGIPPVLLILDNLMNTSSGGENEWAGLREMSQVFHFFATDLGIVALVLHHVNVAGMDLTLPAPLNAIKGQVTELPATVLTWAHQDGKILVAPVKNRHGRADQTGRTFHTLAYDEERQIISDLPEARKKGWTIERRVDT